jgi:anti-sigma28 factor (negative regulator of flagellin synthesis)
MEIKPISGSNINLVKNNIVKKQEEQQKQDTSAARDRLEISEEAKSISSASIKGKNLDDIKSKVESGFYDSDDVINKVADKILKDISE